MNHINSQNIVLVYREPHIPFASHRAPHAHSTTTRAIARATPPPHHSSRYRARNSTPHPTPPPPPLALPRSPKYIIYPPALYPPRPAASTEMQYVHGGSARNVSYGNMMPRWRGVRIKCELDLEYVESLDTRGA